jgi:hypothetical protein
VGAEAAGSGTPKHCPYAELDPRNCDLVAEAMDEQNLLPLANGKGKQD